MGLSLPSGRCVGDTLRPSATHRWRWPLPFRLLREWACTDPVRLRLWVVGHMRPRVPLLTRVGVGCCARQASVWPVGERGSVGWANKKATAERGGPGPCGPAVDGQVGAAQFGITAPATRAPGEFGQELRAGQACATIGQNPVWSSRSRIGLHDTPGHKRVGRHPEAAPVGHVREPMSGSFLLVEKGVSWPVARSPCGRSAPRKPRPVVRDVQHAGSSVRLVASFAVSVVAGWPLLVVRNRGGVVCPYRVPQALAGTPEQRLFSFGQRPAVQGVQRKEHRRTVPLDTLSRSTLQAWGHTVRLVDAGDSRQGERRGAVSLSMRQPLKIA